MHIYIDRLVHGNKLYINLTANPFLFYSEFYFDCKTCCTYVHTLEDDIMYLSINYINISEMFGLVCVYIYQCAEENFIFVTKRKLGMGELWNKRRNWEFYFLWM